MDKGPIWGVLGGLAATVIGVALSQLSVGPWVWGGILVFAAVVFLISIAKMVRGTSTKKASKISGITPPVPLKWWVSTSQFARLMATDSLFRSTNEGDYSLDMDTRYQMSRPMQVDVFSMELMGERINGASATGFQ